MRFVLWFCCIQCSLIFILNLERSESLGGRHSKRSNLHTLENGNSYNGEDHSRQHVLALVNGERTIARKELLKPRMNMILAICMMPGSFAFFLEF